MSVSKLSEINPVDYCHRRRLRVGRVRHRKTRRRILDRCCSSSPGKTYFEHDKAIALVTPSNYFTILWIFQHPMVWRDPGQYMRGSRYYDDSPEACVFLPVGRRNWVEDGNGNIHLYNLRTWKGSKSRMVSKLSSLINDEAPNFYAPIRSSQTKT